MSASDEITRSETILVGAKDEDPCHDTLLVTATTASQASVPTRPQQRRLYHHQSLSVANLHAVYKSHQQGNAGRSRKSSAEVNVTVKEVMEPPIRRHSDSYMCRRLARSRCQWSLPSSSPNSQSQQETREVKVMPLSSGGMTGVPNAGTGHEDQSVRGWNAIEQQKPRFRLEPLATRKSCQGATNPHHGQQVASKCARNTPDTSVTQFPRLCDPAARTLSKSVRDFSKLGHPGTFVH